jgi:hypothetical protein
MNDRSRPRRILRGGWVLRLRLVGNHQAALQEAEEQRAHQQRIERARNLKFD